MRERLNLKIISSQGYHNSKRVGIAVPVYLIGIPRMNSPQDSLPNWDVQRSRQAFSSGLSGSLRIAMNRFKSSDSVPVIDSNRVNDRRQLSCLSSERKISTQIWFYPIQTDFSWFKSV